MNKLTNIINIEEYRFKKLINNAASIREFGDRYEYCFISEYEEKYDNFICDSIELGEVFVQLLTIKDRQKLVSIDFSKDLFDIGDIPYFLDLYGFKMLNNGETTIDKASEVLKALKFKGTPIVFYEKGTDTVEVKVEELTEITEVYEASQHRVNTASSKVRKSIAPESKIFLNDRELVYIPKIKIDLNKDIIISNGNIIKAGFIMNYEGSVGFFKNEYDTLPLAWINDKETSVFIEIYKEDGRKIVIVEYNYIVDLDKFL